MDLSSRYPAISDLRDRARARVPRFVWDYLDSATGSEAVPARNRAALDRVLLAPSILHGEITPELSVRLLGQDHPLPFGIAPVGMSGLVWPGAELTLAALARDHGLPYGLSTVASRTPEDVAPHLGDHGWFQLYPPRDPDIRDDILARARKAGFGTLVLTVDVPVASRRERQTRGGMTTPPRLSPRILAQVARHPAWALATLRSGLPRLRLMESYSDITTALPSNAHIGYLLRTSPDLDYVRMVRDLWDGPLVLKGVLDPAQAGKLESEGIDGVWISNHAGRQFDGAPSTIEMLPALRAATRLPIIFDSGAEGGLDILRALGLGADFVMLGRAWHYALGALGARGPDHLADMLEKDLLANMGQIGAARFSDLPARLRPLPAAFASSPGAGPVQRAR